MRKLKNYLKKEEVIMVTHDGVCHTDEVAVTALLQLYFEANNIKTSLIRTRDITKVPDDSIIYDVFGGELDHHQSNKIIEGETRLLSSIGKVWRWGKKEFIKTFNLNESVWNEIDLNLIASIDQTDCTGVMNPLNYIFNNIRGSENNFETCLDFMKSNIKAVLKNGKEVAKMEKKFQKLPTRYICGIEFKINNSKKYLKPSNCEGYIWKTEDGNYGVRVFKYRYSIIPGLKEDNEILFTHANGFMGIVKNLEAVEKIIIH